MLAVPLSAAREHCIFSSFLHFALLCMSAVFPFLTLSLSLYLLIYSFCYVFPFRFTSNCRDVSLLEVSMRLANVSLWVSKRASVCFDIFNVRTRTIPNIDLTKNTQQTAMHHSISQVFSYTHTHTPHAHTSVRLPMEIFPKSIQFHIWWQQQPFNWFAFIVEIFCVYAVAVFPFIGHLARAVLIVSILKLRDNVFFIALNL